MVKTDVILGALLDPKWQMASKIFVQKEQFESWMQRFFYLNDHLHKEYDLIYQEHFTVVLFQLLTEGYDYLQKVITIMDKQDNQLKKQWYNRLKKGLDDVKEQYDDNEFAYLEYRRHNVCHIFQNGYELIQDDGKIKKQRSITQKDGKKIVRDMVDVELKSWGILEKYGSDAEYDSHYRTVLYPIINQLYVDLQNIHNKEMADEDKLF